MTHGDKLDDIIQAAVARGDAPGVVAAVSRGDETEVAVRTAYVEVGDFAAGRAFLASSQR